MQFTLTHGGRTAVIDTHGGELVSYRDEGGTEYIWHGDPDYWEGRNPLLFPIVGSLKDGRITIEGGQYAMERHGFARHMTFTVIDQTASTALLELRESPETMAQYPYPFCLRVGQELLDSGFRTTLSVTNTGTGKMPFCIGAHTAFNCPLTGDERFEDYIVRFDERQTLSSILPTPEGLMSDTARRPCLTDCDHFPLDHGVFDAIDTLVLEGLASKAATLANPATGRGVRIEFQGFPMMGIWTMPHKKAPYICLEPWHGCSHVLGEAEGFWAKRHVIGLEAGETHTLCYTVSTL